ncbi:hypothetical protein PY257_15815 [Ramlibacter sp. H39-3-26]|uniref:hypothetical protein n=1 Tax=Curvibacter soli TaxID=3031331 RepID=UPI0023DA0FF0|nr:hypothetical protein [Ramlibacter sp. H39-3-26]MDF1486626.1 hypothetical protein [Ramlibacter sp. H39-3-26]
MPGQDTRLLAVEWVTPDAPHQVTPVNRIAVRHRAADLGTDPSPANNLSAARLWHMGELGWDAPEIQVQAQAQVQALR